MGTVTINWFGIYPLSHGSFSEVFYLDMKECMKWRLGFIPLIIHPVEISQDGKSKLSVLSRIRVPRYDVESV
jgi:hypothetical protein